MRYFFSVVHGLVSVVVLFCVFFCVHPSTHMCVFLFSTCLLFLVAQLSGTCVRSNNFSYCQLLPLYGCVYNRSVSFVMSFFVRTFIHFTVRVFNELREKKTFNTPPESLWSFMCFSIIFELL